MTESFKKWPVEIVISKVVSSVLGEEISVFFVTGLMNKVQLDTIKQYFQSTFFEYQVDDNNWVFSSLLGYNQLEAVKNSLENPAKEWRGQYYVVAQKFLKAAIPFLD